MNFFNFLQARNFQTLVFGMNRVFFFLRVNSLLLKGRDACGRYFETLSKRTIHRFS